MGRRPSLTNMQTIRELLTRLGVMAAHPGAFGILTVYAVLWFVFDRKSFDWHAAAMKAKSKRVGGNNLTLTP